MQSGSVTSDGMSAKQPRTMEDWFDRTFDDRDRQALLAFGHFVTAYADIESWCHVMFRRYSGIPGNVARAIAGGARFSDLLQILQVVIQDDIKLSDDDKAEFRLCLDQLNHLTALRHRLIHRGGFRQRSLGENGSQASEFVSHNALTAKARQSAEVLHFGIHDIKSAAWDCARIHSRLQLMGIPGGTRAAKDLLEPAFRELTYGPWFYKPVQPEKPVQRPRKTQS
jgi:hypothetical protein